MSGRPFPATSDSRAPGYVDEASNRQVDRMMASASKVKPAARPNAEPDDPMTVIQATGRSGAEWFISFGPADIEAVITELELGAPCGICHHNPCSWRKRAPVVTPLDLARLSELAEKATGGPWMVKSQDEEALVFTAEPLPGTTAPTLVAVPRRHNPKPDAAFIAAFDPTTAKALLSEIARLRAALDRLVKAWDMGVDPDASKWKALDREINAALEQARETLSLAATEPAEREAAR